MSEFVIDDWKLKARTVVKLYRKNTNTLVCQLVKDKKMKGTNEKWTKSQKLIFEKKLPKMWTQSIFPLDTSFTVAL